MKTLKLLATIALAAAVSAPVFAVEDDAAAGAAVITPLQIIKTTDLDFGIIAPRLTAADTVKVLRNDPYISVCGAELTCFASGGRGNFKVTGEPFASFTLSNPGSITVSDGAGNSMLVDSFIGGGSSTNDYWGGGATFDATGISHMHVGATLYVGANQPVGTYVGTFTVTAEYQ